MKFNNINLEKPFLDLSGGSLYIGISSFKLTDFVYNKYLDANIKKEILDNDDLLSEFLCIAFNDIFYDKEDELKNNIIQEYL